MGALSYIPSMNFNEFLGREHYLKLIEPCDGVLSARPLEDAARYGFFKRAQEDLSRSRLDIKTHLERIMETLNRNHLKCKLGDLLSQEFQRIKRLIAEEVELVAFLPDKQQLYEELFGEPLDLSKGEYEK